MLIACERARTGSLRQGGTNRTECEPCHGTRIVPVSHYSGSSRAGGASGGITPTLELTKLAQACSSLTVLVLYCTVFLRVYLS